MNNQKWQILEWLYSLHRFGIKPGLERIYNLLNFLGNPEKKLKTIHIAGTNGKGTTATAIASILMQAGYKVGLYTSPHLVDFNERIQINGKVISDETLVHIAVQLKEKQVETGATFFELTTAIAFKYFADEKVDFAVIEAGMGGKNDATNVLNPILSVITSISLEHQDYLGNTLEQIAEDKSGIIKNDGKTLISDENPDLVDFFRRTAFLKNNQLYYLDDLYKISKIVKSKYDYKKIYFYKSHSNIISYFRTKLPGKIQARNLLTAFTAIQMIDSDNVDDSTIRKGILNLSKNFIYLGRFQFLNTDPLIILDVAHNPSAFEKLIENLQPYSKKVKPTLMLALMADKDIGAITQIIANHFNKIIITKPKIERAAEPELIKNKFLENGHTGEIKIISNSDEAYLNVIQEKKTTVIAGSFYLVGEVLDFVKKKQSKQS